VATHRKCPTGALRRNGIRSSAVDPERGYSEERRYPDDRGYPEPDWRDRDRRGGYDEGRVPAQHPTDPRFSGFGDPGYADPGYGTQREPAYDPRGVDPRSAVPNSPPGGGVYGPRQADRPPMPPMSPESAHRLDPLTAEVPRAQRGADKGVYRSSKPLYAVALGIFLGVFELIMLLQFVRGVFGSPSDLHRVLAGGLMLMGLPAFGIGLYALLTGAAHSGPQAFLRTPLAYLPVGLILMVAAGAAA
jgi:hypothetical protein